MPGIRQSVLIGNNGFDTGHETGRTADYLICTESMELPPAPKIGIILEERKKKTNGEKAEVIITGLSPHGNAVKSGLQKEDSILAIDNQPVHTISDIKYALLDKSDKDTVIISIRRNQHLGSIKEMNIPVQLSLFPR
jgi:S1-C subfamily serine protease